MTETAHKAGRPTRLTEREHRSEGFVPHNMMDYEETYSTFSIAVPEYYNFGFDVVDAWAKKDRNKLAMIWTNQEGKEKYYTFRQMMNLSNQIANMMFKQQIGKGDRVMILLPRVPEWWTFALAAIKIGAVLCPSPVILTPQDLKYRINQGKFKMIVTNTENVWKLEELGKDCPTLEVKFLIDGDVPGWINYQKELIHPARASTKLSSIVRSVRTKATDPMLIFFSSGTTADPKMVLHTHAYPLGHIVTGRFWYDLTENDLHFTVADTGWGKSSWGKFYGPWMQGACVFVYDYRGKFNATELLPLIEKYEITTFCAPPTIYRMLILADLETFDFSELRHCLSAGETLNPEVNRVWEEGTNKKIYEAYGQTETVAVIATFPCMEVRPGSIGKPAPGWKVELHDDAGTPVPPGVEGRIAIRTSDPSPVGLFTEYLDDPESTAKVFVDGWYYTGDKASVDEDGYFWFMGRDDDMIKSSGYRVSPAEVESALIEHPAVKESAVVGKPDPIRGVTIKAFVVLKDGYKKSDALIKEMQNHVKTTTAPYKYPRSIEFVDELPKTISGKVRRVELRDLEMKRYQDAHHEEFTEKKN
ncbi:MAG TPA: AMP-binding protein [Methanocorpusculum sp.]|nr:AMP-binding protein [Methanocorpusculum sp.]